jgi:hypothetical protein
MVIRVKSLACGATRKSVNATLMFRELKILTYIRVSFAHIRVASQTYKTSMNNSS